jgi:hypothetical protein
MKDIESKGQTISFCGVGAHHQNGIAEKRIGDLQRRATTILLHAQRRWCEYTLCIYSKCTYVVRNKGIKK